MHTAQQADECCTPRTGVEVWLDDALAGRGLLDLRDEPRFARALLRRPSARR